MKAQEFFALGYFPAFFCQRFDFLLYAVEFRGLFSKAVAQLQGMGIGIKEIDVVFRIEEREVVALAVNVDK